MPLPRAVLASGIALGLRVVAFHNVSHYFRRRLTISVSQSAIIGSKGFIVLNQENRAADGQSTLRP